MRNNIEGRVVVITGASSGRYRSGGCGPLAGQTGFNGALNGPLGLTIAPNGHIITANAGDGNLVETTPAGAQVAVKTVETATGAGSLFGVAIVPGGRGVYFVDDGDNTLKVLESKTSPDTDDDDGGD